MRVLFAASPVIAIPTMKSIINSNEIELAGILTNCDTPKGRHGTPLPTEIAQAVQELNLAVPVFKPLKLDAKAREEIGELKADILVSFAYGKIFGPKFLSLFPLGGINIHPSLLPKYRGPSPIQAAILNRDIETGISIQTLAEKMDTGDVLCARTVRLTGRETAESLGFIMAELASEMLPSVLKEIAAGTAKPVPQKHDEATYCSLLKRDDGLIDWNQSAAEIDAKTRAYTPWPLCRTVHNGRELFILKTEVIKDGNSAALPGTVFEIDKQHGILIQTGCGALAVLELQYQAKKALFWRDFLNGARDFLGSRLGS